ncbi:type I secretion system permease/ATPase [Jhaorihella thermophila]|uniref:ATP-binding cassette, subfamily C n=1 Tax=Jhaorihella thermophila TaxID=488547 RepID=A0A1H5Y8D3_9RHOB|nr:type I secretion system permease/ATPase [Jhaorihella thermophila]SEG19850.1 ATP-binding cassette, subfamily C [Jhaorihella thermophila]
MRDRTDKISEDDLIRGRNELRAARRASRRLILSAGFFSIFVNALMLTGPMFMLQVYDRVLGSRSEETLAALFGLMAFLFLMMGVLDWARGRILARAGARFQALLDRRVFSAVLKKAARGQPIRETENQLKDLEAVQKFFGSNAFGALMDLPWTPLFLVGIMVFHPFLGALAIIGGSISIALTMLNQILTKNPVVVAAATGYKADRYAENLQTEGETIRSLGMQEAAFERWNRVHRNALQQGVRANDLSGSFLVGTKTFRLFLQSAMLGVGAYVVLKGEASPGVMIAASILLGRALAPVDLVVGQWPMVQRARRGWEKLTELLAEVPPDETRIDLPRPKAHLEVEQLTVVPPGARQASLRLVNFEIKPGQAVGVVGPSGAGKSTLARAVTGIWHPAGGKIRLDGAALDQYDPVKLARYIGYLPQRVQLFEGTVAENIARLELEPDSEKVVEAAKRAAAHDMITKLPQGYNTPISMIGTQLSGGQIQRIGLARALYGDPVLLVLDEPNSNLDTEGSNALNEAIRQMKASGGAVLIMAHRQEALRECDMLLVLGDGVRKAWGPPREIMAGATARIREIQTARAANNPVGVS